VQVDSRGFITVDAQGRTNNPRVFAIGDVAGEPMLAHKAAHEGRVVAELLAGQPTPPPGRAIPAAVFTDPEIAWVGLTETEAKRQNRMIETALFPWAASGRAQAVGRTEGLTKWIIDPATQRVIGCGVVGCNAGDLIGEAAVAVASQCTIHDIANVIHPHPTLCETFGGAADVHLGLATDLYRPKRTRS
jgi:dihydrolipoamide dehydrogenase